MVFVQSPDILQLISKPEVGSASDHFVLKAREIQNSGQRRRSRRTLSQEDFAVPRRRRAHIGAGGSLVLKTEAFTLKALLNK